MPPTRCTAAKADGEQCRNNSSHDDGLCGVHHNVAVRQAEEARLATRIAEMTENQRQQEAQHAANEREKRVRQNAQRLEKAPASNMDDMIRYARLLSDIWIDYRIPGNDLSQAYCLLRKTSIQDASWATLMRAVANIVNVAYFDPDERAWTALTPEIQQAALQQIREAIAPFEPLDVERSLRDGDRVYIEFRRRLHEERNRRREEEMAARFEQQQRRAPVVFERDPEGGIDLKAFSTDTENVHRSSVQTTTSVGIRVLMKRPVMEGQETLAEIIPAFQDPRNVRFGDGSKERAITELTNDYYTTVAFGHGYNDVLDRVWSYISFHTDAVELLRRLAQEICEGVGQCANGKMARLINVLWGYDQELMEACQSAAVAAPKEAFHAKFSTLRSLPVSERATAAAAVFEEFKIAEAERSAWLEPLMAWMEEPALGGANAENQMILEEV